MTSFSIVLVLLWLLSLCIYIFCLILKSRIDLMKIDIEELKAEIAYLKLR